MAYNLKGFPELWRSFTASSNEREVSSYLDLNGFGDAWNRALNASEKSDQKQRKQSVGLHKLEDFAPAWENLVRAGIQKFSGNAGSVLSKSQSGRLSKKSAPQTQQQQLQKTNNTQQLSKSKQTSQQSSKSQKTAQQSSFPDWLVNLDESEFAREYRQRREADLSDFSAFWDVSTNANNTARARRDQVERRVGNEKRSNTSKNLKNASAHVGNNSELRRTEAVTSLTNKTRQAHQSNNKSPQVQENVLATSGRAAGQLNATIRGNAQSIDARVAAHNEHRDSNEFEQQAGARELRNATSAARGPQFSKERITAAIFYLANAGLGHWASPLLREAASRDSQAFGATAVFLSEVARRAKLVHAIGKFDPRTHRIAGTENSLVKIQLSQHGAAAFGGQNNQAQAKLGGQHDTGAFRTASKELSSSRREFSSLSASIARNLSDFTSFAGVQTSQRNTVRENASSLEIAHVTPQGGYFDGRQPRDQFFGKSLERLALISIISAINSTKTGGSNGRVEQHHQSQDSHAIAQLNHLRKAISVEEHQLSACVSKKIKTASCDMSEKCGYMKRSGSRFINVKVRKHSIFHKP